MEERYEGANDVMKGGKKQYDRDELIYDDYGQPRPSKGAMKNGTQRNVPVWEQGSMDSLEMHQYAKTKQMAADYTFSKPWDPTESTDANNEMRAVQAEGYELVAPWTDDSTDEDNELQKNQNSLNNYQYKTLWEPVPQTQRQKQQLADYKIDPPFQTKFTPLADPKRPSRRPITGNNYKSLAPYLQGREASQPSSMKVQFSRPSTSLWAVPKPTPETTLESSGDRVLDNLRIQLKRQGANGILGLGRKFRIMDDDGSGTLDKLEFCKAMNECKLDDLSKKAIEHLFHHFDTDDSGSVSYDEFLVGVRGVMSARRRELVQSAFEVLDKDYSGVVDIDDIRGVYNACNHPDVVGGRKSEDQILSEFLKNFEGGKGVKDGRITLEEFESYYTNLSSCIDSDDYFELMIRNAWHISGGEGAYENSTNRRVLVTDKDGNQIITEIKNDLGMKSLKGGKKGGAMGGMRGIEDEEEIQERLRINGPNSNPKQERLRSNVSNPNLKQERLRDSGCNPKPNPDQERVKDNASLRDYFEERQIQERLKDYYTERANGSVYEGSLSDRSSSSSRSGFQSETSQSSSVPSAASYRGQMDPKNLPRGQGPNNPPPRVQSRGQLEPNNPSPRGQTGPNNPSYRGHTLTQKLERRNQSRGQTGTNNPQYRGQTLYRQEDEQNHTIIAEVEQQKERSRQHNELLNRYTKT